MTHAHETIENSFLQSDAWGSFRESLGWHAHKVGSLLILERRLPFNHSFLYSPEVYTEPEVLIKLIPAIREIATRRQAIFYRLELTVEKETDLSEQWLSAFRYTHFHKAFEEVQPEHRQIIPLSTEDAVLEQMKPKGRYNIRLAEKSGVLVREATLKTLKEDIATFYSIFQVTAKRDKFSIRPESYFHSLAEMLYQQDYGRVFIASHEDQPLAAAIITLFDGVAAYLYGASSNDKRQLMAPYAMHWSAMQWAMSHDAKLYDLLAIRPPGEKKHAYDGITRFKQQFGGYELHTLGSWDLPLHPTWYTLFATAEKLRRR